MFLYHAFMQDVGWPWEEKQDVVQDTSVYRLLGHGLMVLLLLLWQVL